jgi:hypothetical protein
VNLRLSAGPNQSQISESCIPVISCPTALFAHVRIFQDRLPGDGISGIRYIQDNAAMQII